MATRSKPTKPATAGHRCRLTLSVDGTDYAARPIKPADLPIGATRGYTLTRADRKLRRVRYAVVAGPGWCSCTCGSVRYRSGPAAFGGRCKHLLAARAVGLL